MITFFKKYWLFLVLAFIATILLFVKLFLTTSEQPKTTNITPVWQGVSPGNTAEQLQSALGEPQAVTTTEGQTVLSYKKKDGGHPHQIILDNKSIGLIKESKLGGNIEDYKKQYGAPDAEYFGDMTESGYKLFVYTSRGMAIHASTGDGFVYEVWYFQPTTLSSFLTKWGKDLSLTPEPHEEVQD